MCFTAVKPPQSKVFLKGLCNVTAERSTEKSRDCFKQQAQQIHLHGHCALITLGLTLKKNHVYNYF